MILTRLSSIKLLIRCYRASMTQQTISLMDKSLILRLNCNCSGTPNCNLLRWEKRRLRWEKRRWAKRRWEKRRWAKRQWAKRRARKTPACYITKLSWLQALAEEITAVQISYFPAITGLSNEQETLQTHTEYVL